MNNKALSNTVVAIIAVMVSGLVIIGVLFPIISEAKEKQAEGLCKTSVAVRAGTAIKIGLIEAQTAPLLCKTLTPLIKEDRETVPRVIADKMARCWEIFGEGTYVNSVFDTLNIFSGKGCFTCYVLPVEETSGFKEGRDIIPPEEFMEFLRTEKYPAGSNQTYLQYFQTAGGPGNVINLLSEKGIQPNHAYAVSYKAGTGTCEWCGVIGGTAGASVGVAAGLFGALLLVIPEPTSKGVAAALLLKAASVIGTGLIAKGAAAGVAGVTVAGYSAWKVAEVIDEAAIDTIILSDITSEQVNYLMRQSCNFVEDIEGKKLSDK